MKQRILLVEDDSFLRDGLTEVLQGEGYEVISADNCIKARELIKLFSFNLIMLDVMMPDGSGLELCTDLRAAGNNVPILFLTACDDEIQIVRGLDAGADDFVTKPFKLRELLSRIRALLRRTSAVTVYNSDDITIDTLNMSVRKKGENIFVTPTEFQILSVLIRNSGIIVTRSQLLQNIWDSDGNYIDDNTLSVHMSRLRDKIGSGHIATVRGIGYRWEDSK